MQNRLLLPNRHLLQNICYSTFSTQSSPSTDVSAASLWNRPQSPACVPHSPLKDKQAGATNNRREHPATHSFSHPTMPSTEPVCEATGAIEALRWLRRQRCSPPRDEAVCPLGQQTATVLATAQSSGLWGFLYLWGGGVKCWLPPLVIWASPTIR